MRRSAATMSWLQLLQVLAVLCLLQGGQARPQRAGPGPAPPLPHHAHLSGAAANSMAPLTSEWRDESVRRLSGPEDVSPYAWKPLLSESPKRPARTSRDQQHHEPDSKPAPPEPKQPVSAPAGAPESSAAASAPVGVLVEAPVDAPVDAPVAAPLIAPHAAPGPAAEQATSRAQPETSPSAMSSPSGPYLPSPPSSPSSPSGPSAPSGTSPIGESLKEVASQLMGVTAAPNTPSVTKPQEVVLQDVRTPPIVKASTNNVIVSNNNHHVKPIKAQNLRQSDLPKPVVVSATVSTERDDDQEGGFQGVAEPVVLADEHTAEHTAVEVKKGNASTIMTTAEPQPSTTSSDRISTWILLSGTHSSATTPSSLKKRPPLAPGSIVSKPQEGTPKLPSAPQQRPQQVRPMPVRKPNPAQNKLVSKRPPTTSSSTTTTTSTPAPATSTSSPQTAEYVKISETIISSVQKPKVSNNSQENNKKLPKPTNNTEAIAMSRRPVQDKTKISSASVPFNTAVSHRRKPIHGSPILAIPDAPAKPAKAPKPVSASLKTTTAQTTPKPTTTTPAPEEITTVPSTIPELAVTTEDPNVATTIIPPSSTKKPKRTSTSSKKKKKKKKNKTRRRRPSKKTTSSSNHGSASSATALESKIGNEGNVTSNKVGQNGISTKIYNYLAREVMPSVSVGIIGLVVTAGIAGLFLYPFGGGIAARRTYDEATPEHHHHGDHVYYYENYADHGVDSPAGKPEEEVLGQVFSGMQQQQQQQHQAPETRYGAAPPIYGGGNSGPPDAQYSDSYNRYDPSGKGSTFGRPDANADDLRQGTGYSSVSVNGQGQVTGYVDPSPVSVDSKYEALTPDAIQRTRYDVDTPADQVDLTYGGSAVADPDVVPVATPSKKVDESPFVVGSVGSGVDVEAQHGNRYRVDNEAANVDITYGSDHYNHSKDEAVSLGSFSASDHDVKPGNRYSVRVTGGTGHVALAYGSQSTDGVKLEQDVAYGTGTADSRYATASGAQPRSLPAAKLPTTRRRRRSAAEDEDLQLNEIDGPVPNNDLRQTSSARPESDRAEITTSIPEETTTTAPSTEVVTLLDPDTKDKDNFIEGTRKTQTDKEAATESSSISSSVGTSSTADSLRVSYQDQSTSSASTVAPPMWSTTTSLPPAVNATDDPLTALINIFRRVAEFKLRVGMNLLRGTSEAVTKYIGGVTRRMEEAADNLHQMHSLRRRARDLESRPVKHHTKKVLRSYLKKKQL